MHFWESDLLAPLFTYEGTPTTTTEDKMGGDDEYRSVAYFVNVSTSHIEFSSSRR